MEFGVTFICSSVYIVRKNREKYILPKQYEYEIGDAKEAILSAPNVIVVDNKNPLTLVQS